MKIEIQQKDLSNKISIALKAVSRKTNIQIHELIYFEAKNDTLSLTSSDGEISILTKVSCNVIEEGEMAINANIISNIVRKLPDELIKIEVDDAKIKITCNGSKFNILAFDYYEKKDLKVPNVDYLEIQNDKLKR
ncbi:MAG: DNA polymerase III subunit beta, partial [Anaerococcus hydrogenalis]|nr:DNA polymerase III subunit beta [Anaerococcus hydrogenalis]